MTHREQAGGRATFAGTNYQAGVIAYVYAHVLGEARLGWFGLDESVPLTVAGETQGPGDDLRIEFDNGTAVEVQAKRAMTAGAELDSVLERIRARSTERTAAVGLVVGRASSRSFLDRIPGDLERLRSGRTSPLGDEVGRLRGLIADSELRRLYVVAGDFDRPESIEPKLAIQLLRNVLVSPDEAEAAWAVLVADASILSSRSLLRNRSDLVDLLTQKNIAVRPREPDERWHRELDFIQRLLESREGVAAGVALDRLAHEIQTQKVGADVRYRLLRLMGTAALQRGRYQKALAHAQRALVLNPSGADAFRTAAIACLHLGELEMAESFAEQAVAVAGQDPKTWGALAQVRSAKGFDLPDAPPSVSAHPHYLTVLSEIATNKEDWSTVLELTSLALLDGSPQPEALFLRLSALLASSGTDDAGIRIRAAEADTIASDLVALLHDRHPLLAKALVLRSAARERLKRADEAEEDLALARDLDPSDPEAIRLAASRHLAAGEDDIALQVLESRVVEDHPLLLGIRAEIRARSGQDDGAHRDLAAAIQALGAGSSDDAARLTVAEAAIELNELDAATRLVEGVASGGTFSPWIPLFQGRIHMRRGDAENAERLYREAAERDARARDGILAELGIQLLKAKSNQRAVQAFEDAGIERLEAVPMRAYAEALIASNALVRAQQLIERLAERGPLPTWALSLATTLALRQGDPGLAVEHLQALEERGVATPETQIALAKALLELGRIEDAERHIELVVSAEAATPIEQVQAAELLEMAGRPNDAVEAAFRAFRRASHDWRLHRAFASIVLRSKTDYEPATEVAGDTFVVLESSDGRTERHFVYSEGPVDPLRHELLETEAADLMGLRIGDRVSRDGDARWGITWRVTEILPAHVAAFRDVIDNFEARFPEAPFFVAGFKLNPGNEVGQFAPLIASIGERTKHVENVFAIQREQVLPLGVIASRLGTSIEDLMDSARVDSRVPAVIAEWSDPTGQTESIQAAAAGHRLVLTRSALKSVVDFGLASYLIHFELIAPASLVEALDHELRVAQEEVHTGRKSLVPGPAGFRLEEIEAGATALRQRVTRLEAERDVLRERVRIDVRPLSFIGLPESPDEELRNAIGHDSFDAVALAYERDATLLADDLGLRRVAIGQRDRPTSTSSIALVIALGAADLLEAGAVIETLFGQVLARYEFVPPIVELLDLAIERVPGLQPEETERALALLASPLLDAESAATTAARALKTHALRPVHSISLASITDLAVRAMSKRWPRQALTRLLDQAVVEEMYLMPKQVEVIRRALRAYQ